MPQHAKGPRLYRRKDTGIYLIRDTGQGDKSTGSRDRREAEAALACYIAAKGQPRGPATPNSMTIAEALVIYGENHAPHVKDPVRIAYGISALVPFWGDLPISAITGENCRRYATVRARAPGTVRKELGIMQAALNFCKREGYLSNSPLLVMPPKPEPKDRWLTRFEAAKLVRAAWRNPKSKHLARFILVALYTGTRKTAILQLRFIPNVGGGWVNTEQGIMTRRGTNEAETKKRTPPAKLPRQLLAHLRRREKNGAKYVVEINGQKVGNIKTAWATALRDAGIDSCTPHSLRHSAITWAMQRGARMADCCGFFGVSMDTLERTYWHHHPDHQGSAVEAMERKV